MKHQVLFSLKTMKRYSRLSSTAVMIVAPRVSYILLNYKGLSVLLNGSVFNRKELMQTIL